MFLYGISDISPLRSGCPEYWSEIDHISPSNNLPVPPRGNHLRLELHPLPTRRDAEAMALMGSRANDVNGNLVAVGDAFFDLHVKVRKGFKQISLENLEA